MPRGDRTGPAGQGPMTGWGAGDCAGDKATNYPRPGFGRGYGRGFGRRFGPGFGRGVDRGVGRGFGRGFGRRQAAPPGPAWNEFAPDQEVSWLKSQAKNLEESLQQIRERLNQLDES